MSRYITYYILLIHLIIWFIALCDILLLYPQLASIRPNNPEGQTNQASGVSVKEVLSKF